MPAYVAVPTNNSMRSQKGSPGNKRAGAERQDWAKESRLLGEDTSRLGLTDESLPRNVSLTNVTKLRWSLGCSSLVPMMQPADLRYLHHFAQFGCLGHSWNWCVLFEG